MPLLPELVSVRVVWAINIALIAELLTVQRLEDIAFIVRYFVLLEEGQVLLPEGFARMVFHLKPNVINHPFQLRVRIRKGTETFLPREPPRPPAILVNVIGRASLDVADQIREGDIWLQPNQNMRVVRHAVDGNELLALPSDDASHVLLQFLFAFRADQVLPCLDGEHDLNVYLCVCVSHIRQIFRR